MPDNARPRPDVVNPTAPFESPIEDDRDSLVPYECAPCLRPLASMRDRNVAGDGSLRDGDSEFQQLAVNAWRTPKKIRSRHLVNQLASLDSDSRTPAPPATT
jgi:hypothetical protein